MFVDLSYNCVLMATERKELSHHLATLQNKETSLIALIASLAENNQYLHNTTCRHRSNT